MKVVLKDKDGNLETVETELTYKKYQMMSGVKANRKETMHQDKCSVMPIATDADDNQIFAGPFGHQCTTWDGSQQVVKEGKKPKSKTQQSKSSNPLTPRSLGPDRLRCGEKVQIRLS